MFSTYEKIKELADKRGLSLNKLEEQLGYSRNTIYNMRKSTPNSERLKEIADYFNVSTDYLLGRTDNPNISSDTGEGQLDAQEEQALILFRKQTEKMTDSEKEQFNKSLSEIFQFARNLIENDK